uniref:Uncharacterized protein n=1 Tax=Schizaphis graminum TaxID=13262 RepID=A0A2S2PC43_SCHGA
MKTPTTPPHAAIYYIIILYEVPTAENVIVRVGRALPGSLQLPDGHVLAKWPVNTHRSSATYTTEYYVHGVSSRLLSCRHSTVYKIASVAKKNFNFNMFLNYYYFKIKITEKIRHRNRVFS